MKRKKNIGLCAVAAATLLMGGKATAHDMTIRKDADCIICPLLYGNLASPNCPSTR